MILVTSSNWINCSFSRPSKVRMSFCQIAAKFFFFKFKICQTVARHKYDQSISQKIFCCLSLTNYLISKLQLPYIGVISAIVYRLSCIYYLELTSTKCEWLELELGSYLECRWNEPLAVSSLVCITMDFLMCIFRLSTYGEY